MLSVTYFYRGPSKTGLSIEGIFKLVKERLKDKIDIREFYCDPRVSRLQNTIRASRFAGEINHITGDVNFLALGLKGKKNILTIHDMGNYEATKKRSFIRYIIYKFFWYKYPLKYIDMVTVVSDYTKYKLIEYLNFPEDKIKVINNPVKPVFQYVKKEKVNEQPRILMLGSGKHKNLDNLIEAAKGNNFHLEIIGWPAQDELNKLNTYKISYAVYNGLSDEEVYQRYIDCDLLYFASLHEGFGMPIIEAQAVGRPVITSNIGAMKEVAKESAILVDPTNPLQIRNAILRLAEDKTEYAKYVTSGLQNSADYNYEHIAQQYLEVYTEISGLLNK